MLDAAGWQPAQIVLACQYLPTSQQPSPFEKMTGFHSARAGRRVDLPIIGEILEGLLCGIEKARDRQIVQLPPTN
jgi:hypothetical protein